MTKNEVMLPCNVCGTPTPAGTGAKGVACNNCVVRGKVKPKTYFKDEKANKIFEQAVGKPLSDKKPIKEKEVPKEKKTGKKRFGQIKYIRDKITAGLKDEEIVKSIRKDIPEYVAPDNRIMSNIKTQRKEMGAIKV